jgi:hypothetical protein
LESSHEKNAGSTIAAPNYVVGSFINPDMRSLLRRENELRNN